MKLIYAGTNPNHRVQRFMLRYELLPHEAVYLSDKVTMIAVIDDKRFTCEVLMKEFINDATIISLIKPHSQYREAKWLDSYFEPEDMRRIVFEINKE